MHHRVRYSWVAFAVILCLPITSGLVDFSTGKVLQLFGGLLALPERVVTNGGNSSPWELSTSAPCSRSFYGNWLLSCIAADFPLCFSPWEWFISCCRFSFRELSTSVFLCRFDCLSAFLVSSIVWSEWTCSSVLFNFLSTFILFSTPSNIFVAFLSRTATNSCSWASCPLDSA